MQNSIKEPDSLAKPGPLDKKEGESYYPLMGVIVIFMEVCVAILVLTIDENKLRVAAGPE